MTESVTAGALHIQLGGGHFYFGKWVPKDTIGDDIRQVEPEDIVQTNNLMYMTAVLSILVFALIYLLELLLKAKGWKICINLYMVEIFTVKKIAA